MADEFEIERNGVRYFQARNLNRACGDGCNLKRTMTHEEIDVTNFGSGGQRVAIPGLAHDTLYCRVHGVTYERRR